MTASPGPPEGWRAEPKPDRHAEGARAQMGRAFQITVARIVERLISHRFSLEETAKGTEMALSREPAHVKGIVVPGQKDLG